jgi:GNAT superfamily N-acetyltransferase
MSLDYIYYKGYQIIYLDLEELYESADKLDHINKVNALINSSGKKAFVLINLRNFMPGQGFMDFATNTLDLRAENIRKAAYIGIGKKNRKLFEYYDKYNLNIVERKIFEDKEAALLWLTDTEMDIPIKELPIDKIPEFASFVKKVYDEYVAIEYSALGNSTYYHYIEVPEIIDRFTKGNLFYIAEDENEIVGAIELRDFNHISLFFVDKKYQTRGIGKSLFKKILQAVGDHSSFVEVHSSPYARDIYAKMGFELESELLEQNGIKYYKMTYHILGGGIL